MILCTENLFQNILEKDEYNQKMVHFSKHQDIVQKVEEEVKD